MTKDFENILAGYQKFRAKYAEEDSRLLEQLHQKGQTPKTMVIACSDSRVDPAILLQCDPGDLFVVRNIANIVPPYEKDGKHHGTSAALEFAICYLGIEELVILGHSSCGGVQAKLSKEPLEQDDFISSWIKQLSVDTSKYTDCDLYAKDSLLASYQNCLTFPWIKERIDKGAFNIHLWFFDIEHAKIMAYDQKKDSFLPL